MRLIRLWLERYGHVSGECLEFPDGRGLHVVLGANEAGKSTALEAVADGLFGFPTRRNGRANHPDDPRVGFTLRGADGAEASFTRRKTGRDRLLDGTGAPVAETALARFLGGTGRERFHEVFGLDAARLRKSGEAMVAEQGEAGAAILSAQTGLRGLRETAKHLDDEAKTLFGDGRGQRRISSAADVIKQNRRLVADRSVSGSDYLAARKRQDDLAATAAAIDVERRELRAEQAKLARIRGTAPIRAELAEIADQLAALGPALLLPDDAETRARDARDKHARATGDQAREEQEVASIDAQLAALQPDPAILAEAEAITALQIGVGEAVAARRDFLSVNGEAHASLAAIDGHARRLDLPERGAALFDRVPSLGTRIEAGDLLGQRTASSERTRLATEALQATQEDAAEAARTLAELQEPDVPDALRDAVAEVGEAGPVSTELAKAAAQRDIAREAAESLVGRLALWTGGLDRLEATTVPLAAEAARLGEAMDRALAARQAAEAEVTTNADAAEARKAAMQHIEAAAPLPTAEAVADARARRDTAWAGLRRSLDAGEPVPHGLTANVEALLGEADRLADARLAELARVKEWDDLRANLARMDAERPGLLARQDAAREAASLAEAAWRDAWRLAGIVPQGRAAMREWVRDRDAMLVAAKAARAAEAEHHQLAQQEANLRKRLSGQLPPGSGDGLAALLRRGRQCVAQLDEWARTRKTAQDRVAQAEKALAKTQQTHETEAQTASAWSAKWAPVADRLGLAPTADPAHATVLLATWSELDKELDRWRNLDGRLADMQATVQAHEAALAALADRLSVPVSETLLAELGRRRQAAEEAATARKRLDKGRATRLQAVADHANTQAQASADLQALRDAAGVADDAALLQAIAAERKRAELLARLTTTHEALRTLADGKSAAELAEEAASLDADRIPGRQQDIADRLTELDKLATETAGTLVEVRAKLDAMERGQDVAGPAQAVQDALAEIEDAAGHYIRLRLAHALLRGGMDAYRRSQQGPLLARASLSFAELTGNRYVRLEQDEDDQGKPVIVAKRPDGTTCPTNALSEGTRDQLFLALRLAAIAAEAESAEPMPFIADDLLVNFDDERAAAALRLLGRFGRTTQVILFTHHRHLLDLLEPDGASIHRLPRELAA